MWRDHRHLALHGEGDETDIYGRSVFQGLDWILTRVDPKRRTANDYMLSSLVYDNIGDMQFLFSQEVGDNVVRWKLNRQLDVESSP